MAAIAPPSSGSLPPAPQPPVRPGDHTLATGQAPSGWTPARIVAAIIDAVLVLVSIGFLGTGGVDVRVNIGASRDTRADSSDAAAPPASS